MQQPKHPRAKPLDDEMHAYNTKDLERLFGLPASAVRSLTRAGHISPIKRGRRLHYSFKDLLMLRTASALRSAKISANRINRTLQTLRSTLPADAALNQRSLTALGDRIAIREGKMLWESDSGQYVLALDLGEEKGGLHVIPRRGASPPPGAARRLNSRRPAAARTGRGAESCTSRWKREKNAATLCHFSVSCRTRSRASSTAPSPRNDIIASSDRTHS